MAELSLKAEVRTGRGKGPARRLRAAGKVPATVYGRGIEPIAVEVDARSLSHTFQTDAGVNVLIDLQVGGESHLTMAREVERDPLRGDIRHVDFLKIARDQQITVDVPIHFEGESSGVKEGGVLEHHVWQLHLSCLPGNVPERISVDISKLGIGDQIRVADLPAPEGATVLTAAEEIIVTCVVPQKVEELVPAAAEGEEGVAAEGEGAAAPAAEAEGGGEQS